MMKNYLADGRFLGIFILSRLYDQRAQCRYHCFNPIRIFLKRNFLRQLVRIVLFPRPPNSCISVFQISL